MRVLLTGANGFVGSHILERLLSLEIPSLLLLRKRSGLERIESHLSNPLVDVVQGSLEHASELKSALRGVTHVIHAAGVTKALSPEAYYRANQYGTRALLEALASQGQSLERFVFISSLAASGPGTSGRPRTEESPPEPVSAYGDSKLAGEKEVETKAYFPYTILRPPAVYGPRDTDFLPLFKAARSMIVPLPGAGKQELSLVYVKDVAAAIVDALTAPQSANQTLNVATVSNIRTKALLCEIARVMGRRPWFLPLPLSLLWPLCFMHECRSWWSGVPHILNRQKYRDLRAQGWVAATQKAERFLPGLQWTPFHESLKETCDWFITNGYLRPTPPRHSPKDIRRL